MADMCELVFVAAEGRWQTCVSWCLLQRRVGGRHV